jgi:hypothetical protein
MAAMVKARARHFLENLRSLENGDCALKGRLLGSVGGGIAII